METVRPSSVKEFCRRYGINESTFYRHPEDMPRRIKVGGQFRILPEDEREWLDQKRAEAGEIE